MFYFFMEYFNILCYITIKQGFDIYSLEKPKNTEILIFVPHIKLFLQGFQGRIFYVTCELVNLSSMTL